MVSSLSLSVSSPGTYSLPFFAVLRPRVSLLFVYAGSPDTTASGKMGHFPRNRGGNYSRSFLDRGTGRDGAIYGFVGFGDVITHLSLLPEVLIPSYEDPGTI